MSVNASTDVDIFTMVDRVALVTGSTRGMGFAAAEHLARRGAQVVVVGRDAERAGKAADEINLRIGARRATGFGANIGREVEVTGLVGKVIEQFGRLDSLLLHAGLNIWIGATTDLPDHTLRKFLDSSVMSAYWFCQAALPGMLERNWGRLVFTSSVIGSVLGSSDNGPYGISKAALSQLARNLACEYGARGIRANAIAPALFDTRQAESLMSDPERLDRYVARCPVGRVGRPEEFAGLAVLLASDAGGYINGQTINLDGGYSVLWDSYR